MDQLIYLTNSFKLCSLRLKDEPEVNVIIQDVNMTDKDKIGMMDQLYIKTSSRKLEISFN